MGLDNHVQRKHNKNVNKIDILKALTLAATLSINKILDLEFLISQWNTLAPLWHLEVSLAHNSRMFQF